MSSSPPGPESDEAPPPLAAPLWRAGPLAFSFADLIRVAAHLGWLDGERRWLARCDRLLEANPADAEAVQRASESFRYAHDILTAEETERWLESRCLQIEDLERHCERLAVAEAASLTDEATASTDVAPDPAPADPDAEAWRVHLWFSGQARRLARRCAWLLIAAREAGESSPTHLPDLMVWQRWDELLRQQRTTLLAGPKAARMIESRRWPLTRLTVEVTEFANQDVAREAELCLNEGSATMEEIVQGAEAVRDVLDNLVDELAQDLQQEVIAVSVGGLVRLEQPDHPPRIVRVLARTEPSPDDSAVRDRVAAWLQEDLYGMIERDVISWEHPLLRLT